MGKIFKKRYSKEIQLEYISRDIIILSKNRPNNYVPALKLVKDRNLAGKINTGILILISDLKELKKRMELD